MRSNKLRKYLEEGYQKKIYHLSLNLWKSLCIRGLEHGRDVYNLSHISPIFTPINRDLLCTDFGLQFCLLILTLRGKDEGRDEGRDQGRDQGRDEIIGILCIKGFWRSDGRDGGLYRISLFESEAIGARSKDACYQRSPRTL